jgi:hypothetical protein
MDIRKQSHNFRHPAEIPITNRLWLGVLLFVLLIMAAVTGGAAAKEASEYQIKAAYLYNFLKFVQWPEGPEPVDMSQLSIGILGEDPFENSFEAVEGKLINSKNKQLIIKRYGPYAEGADYRGCDLLFICSSEQSHYQAVLKRIDGDHVLTVSDGKDFLESGGMINLIMVDEKIRWEINREPMKKADLKVSSQLLRAAVRVLEN